MAETWLRGHPGIEVVCRDGSGAYGEAARRALPQAVQVSDRWHLWHLLGEAARKEVLAHSCCWAKGTPMQEGKRADTTRERWQQIRDLREKGAGLLDCSRRLGAIAEHPSSAMTGPASWSGCRVRPTFPPRPTSDPHTFRKRRAEEPGIAVQQLLREIRERGYQGSSNLLVRYINQGRLDGDRPHLSPRRATRLLLTRPDRLTGSQQETLARIETACPEISALASHIRDFAALLVPDPGNAGRLQEWITAARAADLPHVHAFTRGLDLDIQAAAAALTMPFHNGRTEGVNTKTKMIKRQMYGRAGFALLRHRILLGLRNVTTGSATEPLNLQSLWLRLCVPPRRRVHAAWSA